MTNLNVPVRLLDAAARVPTYAHPGDAGADLYSLETVRLAPGERALVRTGVAVAIPDGFVGLVHPRSGLAHRSGVTIVNAPGTIDSGYRGELMVNMVNLDPREVVTLGAGERIAQLVLQRVEQARFVLTDDLASSQRGAAGHGSTGR